MKCQNQKRNNNNYYTDGTNNARMPKPEQSQQFQN